MLENQHGPRIPHRHAERNSEQISQAGIRLSAQALLSGLHIPITSATIPVLQSVINQATFDRLPLRAINVVSTREREAFDKQFGSSDEKNEQHEYWLGEVAQRVLSRSEKREHRSAYTCLFGLSVRDILDDARKEAMSVLEAYHPARRSKKFPQEIPETVRSLIDQYQAHLRVKEKKGIDLSENEQQHVSQTDPSQSLLETALAFERIKHFMHESLYVPFLKNGTDSEGLAVHIVQSYAKMHAARISISDISKKAELLHEDLDEMTGKGHVLVGLVRAAAVITSNAQHTEAATLTPASSRLTPQQSLELLEVVKQQRKDDDTALAQARADTRAFTHALHATILQIEDAFAKKKMPDRQTIEKDYLQQFIARQPLFTSEESQKTQPGTIAGLSLLGELPTMFHVRSALKAVSSSKDQEYVLRKARDQQMQASSNLSQRYTAEYFLKQDGTVVGSEELIWRALWEVPLFRNHVQQLSQSFGFATQELQYMITAYIERAWNKVAAFELFGQSLPGLRAQGPEDNRDSMFYDDRFNFMMVADGVGSEEGADTASATMQAACKKVLEALSLKGLRYPYVTQDIARIALATMVSTAADTLFEELSPEWRDYIYGNKDVIDPHTNQPMQAHPEARGSVFQTTFTGVLPYVENGRTYVAIASVGDSRVYLARADKTFSQLTRDDSILWDYFRSYEESGNVLDAILNRFDADVPVHATRVQKLIATSEAIKREVVPLSQETKAKVISDTIAWLSKTLVFTSADLRKPLDEETRELLQLQKFLGAHVMEGIDDTLSLDSKVTAIANYLFLNRNLVGKCVGIRRGYIKPQDIVTTELFPGDTLFVTTDGFHDSVSEPRFIRTIAESSSIQEQVRALHKEVLACLGCERVQGAIIASEGKTKSVRGKPDDGVSIIAAAVTHEAIEQEDESEKDTLLLTA